MRLYRTVSGYTIEEGGRFYLPQRPSPGAASWDALVVRDDLRDYLQGLIKGGKPAEEPAVEEVLAPVGSQEIWAAGVTYYRSRQARIEESRSSGGGSFYDRVYEAERPELFFKATPNRVAGTNGKVAIRHDSQSSVPEPELTLLVTPRARIVGYTIGNDMTSRDIEGENPLYLPQAKVYQRCCALGPCLLISHGPLPPSTQIQMEILRQGKVAFAGATSLSHMKREPATLVEYLYRDNEFPNGCFLLTGTGIVPPESFTLKAKDEIHITITGIGTLVNTVG